MSSVLIRKALETGLQGFAPAIDIAWENVEYVPTGGVPYVKSNVLFAKPQNPTIGGSFYQQPGIYQLTLRYPLGAGPGAIGAQAEALRAFFVKGKTFTSGAITVSIINTPEIAPPIIDGDRWSLPVKVPFFANVN